MNPQTLLKKRFSQLTSLVILLGLTIVVWGLWYTMRKTEALAENLVSQSQGKYSELGITR